YYQRWTKYVQEFGDDEDLVAVVEGGTRPQMIAALDEIAGRVAAQPELFDRLNYKVDLRPLRKRSLLFLPVEQLRGIQDHLRHMAMLLEPPVIGLIDPLTGWKHLTLFELLDKSALVNGPFNPEEKLFPERDPLLRQLNVLSKNVHAYLDDPAKYASPWNN